MWILFDTVKEVHQEILNKKYIFGGHQKHIEKAFYMCNGQMHSNDATDIISLQQVSTAVCTDLSSSIKSIWGGGDYTTVLANTETATVFQEYIRHVLCMVNAYANSGDPSSF